MTTASCARRRIAAPAIVLAAALALAACSGDTGPTGPPLTRSIAIDGTAVALTGTTVESTCFTFEMPTVMPYEINPDSAECMVAIRPEGISMGQITLVPQKGDTSPEAFEDAIKDAAEQTGGEYEIWQEAVDGIESQVVEMPDGLGLPIRFYQVPVRSGGFVLGREQVTSIFISGHVGADETREALEAVVASLRVLN